MKPWLLFILTIMLHSNTPAEVKHIRTSDGVDLYVSVKGNGPPCLYLHGGPGSGSHWLERFSGEMLERHFRMIYLDQRGVGRSTSPASGDYSVARMLQDFEEVRTSLDIPQWLTLGHSFGGILQMQYAKAYPAVIRGMVMVNCSLNMTESGRAALPKALEILNEPGMDRFMNDSIPMLVQMTKIYGRLREKQQFWRMGYALKASEDSMNSSFREIPNWNSDYEAAGIALQENWEDYKPLTAHMRMPVLFYYGRTDYMVGSDHYKGVNFPTMLLWGGAVGHMPFLENREDLEAAISTYVARYGF